MSELSYLIFNDEIIPKVAEGYRQHLREQNKTGLFVLDALNKQTADIQSNMDNLVSVIMKSTSDALVSKLNALDAEKQALIKKQRRMNNDCTLTGPTEDDLLSAFKLAREMLRTGRLPNIKALIERYVHKVIVSGASIEVQFNLNLTSRVVKYSADTYKQKETPQCSGQEVTEVLSFVPTNVVASWSG